MPDASTIGRFRQKLVDADLWEQLLGEVNRQLEVKHIIMTEGRINIIDATPIEAAQSGPGKGVGGQPKRDPEAGWHVKADSRGNMKSTYGYSIRKKLESFGIEDQVQRKGYRGHPLSAADVIRNDKIAVTRSGGERLFATYKSRYGLARTRLMGLVRNMTFYGLAAIAHNIQKGAKFLLLYGLLEAEQVG